MTTQKTLFEMHDHTKGVFFVRDWLRDVTTPGEELYEWTEIRRGRCVDDQLQYIDQVNDCYCPVFEKLPKKLSNVFLALCRKYRKGGHVFSLDCDVSASTHLSRLIDGGLVERTGRGVYKVKNIDVLRYFAVKCDNRFQRWFQKDTGSRMDVLDRFMDYVEELECSSGAKTETEKSQSPVS